MSQEDRNRGAIEAEQLSKLFKGQKLFEELLKDKSLFLDLGYTEYQAALANRVLSNLNRQGNVQRIGDEFLLETKSDDDSQHIEFGLLRRGGYHLTGIYDYREEEMRYAQTREERLIIMLSKEATQPVFSGNEDSFVAHLRILPKDLADMPKEDLVRALYEGSEGTGELVAMHERDEYTELASEHFSSVAIFQASWAVEPTSQDLVVSTNYVDKGDQSYDAKVNIEVWRRLPDISFKGKLWTPFGRLPSKLADKLMH